MKLEFHKYQIYFGFQVDLCHVMNLNIYRVKIDEEFHYFTQAFETMNFITKAIEQELILT